MKRFFSGKVRAILAAALVLAVVAGVTLSVSDGQAGFARNAVNTVLKPFRSAATLLTDKAEAYYSYIYRYDLLEAENQELRQRIAQMQAQIRTAEENERENQRLRELLELPLQEATTSFVDARVSSWDGSNWSSGFVISKGSSHGLESGMCVVDSLGYVVGFLTEVGNNWAQVMTVLDPNAQIGATISSAGYTGVAQGQFDLMSKNEIRMSYLDAAAIVRNGDEVLTVGSGDVYPAGLVIGYVTDVTLAESGVDKYAIIRIAADLSELEQVFVITSFTSGE